MKRFKAVVLVMFAMCSMLANAGAPPFPDVEELYVKGEENFKLNQFEAAYTYLHEAAAFGYADAAFALGMMNAQGLGVKENPEQAYAWFVVAAEYGNSFASMIATKLDAEADAPLSKAAHKEADYLLRVIKQNLEAKAKEEAK